jgi:hypothetical protein
MISQKERKKERKKERREGRKEGRKEKRKKERKERKEQIAYYMIKKYSQKQKVFLFAYFLIYFVHNLQFSLIFYIANNKQKNVIHIHIDNSLDRIPNLKKYTFA